jgi:hypothetical protein
MGAASWINGFSAPEVIVISKRRGGTIGKSSEITISLNFTAEHAENAEASKNPSRIGTVLKLCALRGDKSLDF